MEPSLEVVCPYAFVLPIIALSANEGVCSEIYSWATNGQTGTVGSFDVPVSSISVSDYIYGLGTDDRTVYRWATNGQTSIVGSFDVPVSSISVSGYIYGLGTDDRTI